MEAEPESGEDLEEDSDSVFMNTFEPTLPAVQIALEFYCEHSAQIVLPPRYVVSVYRVRIIQRHGFLHATLL